MMSFSSYYRTVASVRELIGQHLLIGISGKSLTESEKKFIVENNIGGVVLFDRNIETPEQIRSLTHELQSLRFKTKDRLPFFVGIDMEGGRIARLKAPFTQWPALKKIGDLNSPTVAFNFSYFMGLELKAVGINLDFAPCVDVLTNPANTVIGDRSIGVDHELVAKMTSALVRGYMKAEVLSCAKHFPGHGNTLVDSHEDLPIETISKERMDEVELNPFKKAFRARVEMVMTAHIKFDQVDSKWPVTMSDIFLKQILREELRFKGLVITDDLDMKALANHYGHEEIALRSLEAGADLLLYCNEPSSPERAIETISKAIESQRISRESLSETYARISEMKQAKLQNPEPLESAEIKKVVGHQDHFKLAQSIAKGEVPPGLVAPTSL
jgi:beta-N-acetylhexosaminidase